MADLTQQQLDVIQQQDQLRTMRQFVSFFGGMTGQDQTLTGTDFAAVNAPGQFQSVGPHGIAVEGQPIMSYTSQGGLNLAPILVMAGLGLAAWFALR